MYSPMHSPDVYRRVANSPRPCMGDSLISSPSGTCIYLCRGCSADMGRHSMAKRGSGGAVSGVPEYRRLPLARFNYMTLHYISTLRKSSIYCCLWFVYGLELHNQVGRDKGHHTPSLERLVLSAQGLITHNPLHHLVVVNATTDGGEQGADE